MAKKLLFATFTLALILMGANVAEAHGHKGHRGHHHHGGHMHHKGFHHGHGVVWSHGHSHHWRGLKPCVTQNVAHGSSLTTEFACRV